MRSEWIINLESELQNIDLESEIEKQKNYTIHKVPQQLREMNPKAYTPKLVSVGPFHHNRTDLKQMGQYQRLALSNYLTRAQKEVSDIAAAMRAAVKELMASYKELDDQWLNDEEKFLELMVVDACFLLDFMIWGTLAQFWKPYMKAILSMDVLRVENQIPVAALAVLIDVGGHTFQDTKAFIGCYTNVEGKNIKCIKELGDHHLDIYRKETTAEGDYLYDPHYSIRVCTTVLRLIEVELGLSETRSLSDISFKNGRLKLPKFDVDDNTEQLLLNLIAYEQLRGLRNTVTSYTSLMDNLIKSKGDVIVLREKRIITGWVGRDEDVVSLINRLPRGIAFENETENALNENLMKYCYKKKWIAKFKPTLLIGFGFFFSSMTLIQTILAVVAYIRDHPFKR